MMSAYGFVGDLLIRNGLVDASALALAAQAQATQPSTLGQALAREIRRMVEFREINLIQSWQSVPSVHLILMRNVLIYFDVTTKKAILEKAGRLLDPQGYLLLGGAETTTNLDDSFEPVSHGGAVCFRPRGPRPL